MTFKPKFPDAAIEYIRLHIDESRSVLASKVSDPKMFNYPCTKEGVKGVIRKIKAETDRPLCSA